MATVGEYLKFLSSPQNQLSPVALTHKNYFQYLFDPQEDLDVDALQSFFDSALTYPHWQQNKKDFTQESRELLSHFWGPQAETLFDAIDWPEHQQLVEIESPKIALEVLNAYWTFRLKGESAQFRLFEAPDKMFLALILHADQRLSVRQYDSRFLIRNGNLEPLRRDLVLVYDENLELSSEVMHKFEMSPFTVARFYREASGIHGNAVRGYVFQHLQNFHGQSLENFPRLFFALKRVEQLFVRRETDPYYIQLVENLERLLHWMRLGEPIAPHLLHENFLKAQTALEEVFHGDKMLTLLLRDLEHLNAREQLRNPEKRPAVLPKVSEQEPPSWKQKANLGFASIKPSRTVASSRGERPTASSKRGTSPSTVNGSSNSESKWIPTRTKSWLKESP